MDSRIAHSLRQPSPSVFTNVSSRIRVNCIRRRTLEYPSDPLLCIDSGRKKKRGLLPANAIAWAREENAQWSPARLS